MADMRNLSVGVSSRISRSSRYDHTLTPALGQLLQRKAGFELLTAEPRQLGHDEHLERRARFDGVQQPDETGPSRKLGAGHIVVGVRYARR